MNDLVSILVTFLLSSGVGVSVVGFILKRYIDGIDTRFDALIKEMRGLRNDLHSKSLLDEQQSGDLKALQEKANTHERRLNDHAKRIHSNELKLART